MAVKAIAKKDHQVIKLEKNLKVAKSGQHLSIVKGMGDDIMHQAEAYLNANYDFRRNVVLDKTEFKVKNAQKYCRMSERDYNSMYRELRMAGIKLSRTDLRVILNSVFTGTYDPFVEYFEGLPKWDKTDHIGRLADTVKTNDDAFWKECLKKWLVALVASAIRENEVNHTVIVFSGKQGIGKSTWHLNLVPDALKDYRFSGIIKPDSKDSIINLSECLLINLDELESLNKSELGSLKEMITKSAIRVRRPYGFFTEKFVRRASCTGSVNNTQFLSDTTGSRRFLCFEAKSIDYKKAIDMDKVYAQAMHLLNTGYQYWFDQAGIDKVAANNERYQEVKIEEELLLKHLAPEKVKGAGELLTTTEIAKLITASVKVGVSNGFINNLGKVLNKHNFSREKEKGAYKYRVKRVNL